MFSKFKELFSSENLLDTAYTTTVTMLEFDLKMYEAARTVLRDQDTADLPFDIRKMDRRINKYEREVRRNVLTHLAVVGTQNLVPGLVLVSIVIDVERIGDYTKNIVDLATKHKKALKGGIYEPTLQQMEAAIAEHFPKAIEVMKSQDKALAREIMAEEETVGKKDDATLAGLMGGRSDDLDTASAIGVALYTRYLKRINAHLTNISSSIVNPFPRIGFREKIRKPSA